MTDADSQLGSYPEGVAVTFMVSASFGSESMLAEGPAGEEFLLQRLVSLLETPSGGGGNMPSAVSPVPTSSGQATFTVQRSFRAGYLILADGGGMPFFATLLSGGHSG